MTLECVVAGLAERIERRYFGKYRGFVVDNKDPAKLGRLKLRVPSVLGSDVVTGWATACVPFGGAVDQGFLFVPDPGAGVWVEFEEGDLEFPIWVGTFWSKPSTGTEVPKPNGSDGTESAEPQAPPTCKIIKTGKGHTLQFEDAEDNASVTVYDAANKLLLVMDSSGIRITDHNRKNTIVLDNAGVAITEGQGSNELVIGGSGISIGSNAAEALVLGTTLNQNLQTLVGLLSAHVHTGNLGAPTSPPMPPPFTLVVPLSTKHKVE